MSSSVARTTEPIAGYTVQKRIGAGGYGEVWSADAPGGLTKAIKFVYGYMDDDRAARELKALNRIKEVRHPFLLSLERIEVVDGQLIIVTELAEMSLKDRYDRARETGKTGIPRDKLLVYLGDAADALDYMRDSYSLQHLDVKPENLLMVGDRVKVADFGLVKDVHETGASMMGGLTPTYAPPESFDGRPSMQSDQYSLAIVYQEMLTGSLPFPGTTATQLAIQHLDSPPRLGALPESDRAAIARALEKSPDDRFVSCRQLVDSLIEAGTVEQRTRNDSKEQHRDEGSGDTTPVGRHATEVMVEPESSQGVDNAAANTRAFDSDPSPAGGLSDSGHSRHERIAKVRKTTILPPVDVTSEEAFLRPTLLLGLGGTAGSTFRRLRRRLNNRFGNLDAVPAVEMLLLDTDRQAIAAATQGDESEVLHHREGVAMPLRRPQDYREDSGELLKWLSRRWLYNIPRSLETEGRRPLGRLAFVDHSRTVFHLLRSVIGSITSEEALAVSRDATGLEVRGKAPRIFVVSSISGGCGGGMVLDVAYAVRAVLAELGLSDEGLTGVLCHSTSPNPAERDLAIANAYACLEELQHYSGASRFPGDPACNLPPAGDIPTFEDTYLVHLGDEVDDEQFGRATDDLAQYLYLNAATAAGALFDKCRKKEGLSRQRSAGVKLRTFGLYQFGYSHGSIPSAAAEILSKNVILRWLGQPLEKGPASDTRSSQLDARADEQRVDQPFDEHLERLELTFDQIQQQIGAIFEHELGVDGQTYFSSLVRQLYSSRKVRSAEEMFAAVDEVLGARKGPDDSEELPACRLEVTFDRQFRKLARKRSEAIEQWILELVDSPETRVTRAQTAIEQLSEYLISVAATATQSLERLQHEIRQLQQALLGNGQSRQPKPRGRFGFGHPPKDDSEEQQRWTDFCQMRFLETELAAARTFLQSLRGRLAAVGDRVAGIQHELRKLADECHAEQAWQEIGAPQSDEPTAADELSALLVNVIRLLLPKLSAELESRFHEEVMLPRGGLHAVLERTADLDRPLSASLREASRKAIIDALTVVDVADPLLGSEDSSRESERLRDCITEATPSLLACGGARRLLLVLPESLDPAAIQADIQENLGEASSVAFDRDGDIVICHEAQDLSLAQVAAALADDRLDYADAASRLHTRADVRWTSLGGR